VKLSKLIFLAVLLRVFFAAFLYHPDIKTQYYQASFLSQGVFNIYSYISQNKPHLPYTDTFNYPPLIYFLLGSWHKVASVIAGPDLTNWLADWGSRALFHPNIFLNLLVLKIPYFIAEIYLVKILINFGRSEDEKSKIKWLWLFNPLVLYWVYAIGQFDILPALTTIVALNLASKKQYIQSAIFLGLGAALKTYPILLLPIVVFSNSDWKRRLITLTVGLATMFIPMLPFLGSVDFRASVFQSSLGQRLFASGFAVSDQRVIFFVVAYVLIIANFAKKPEQRFLLPSFTAVTLLIILLSQFHIQWLVWLLPFFTLFVSRSRQFLTPVLFIFLSALGLNLLLKDQFVAIGLFSALNPHLGTIPPLVALVTPPPDFTLLASIIRSTLVAFGLLFIRETYET